MRTGNENLETSQAKRQQPTANGQQLEVSHQSNKSKI